MRHRKKGAKLGRDAAHRDAMLRNLATDLLRHERVTTTLAKAKAVRPVAERLVTLGKRDTLPEREHRFFLAGIGRNCHDDPVIESRCASDEILVPEGSPFVGTAIKDLGIRSFSDVLIVAVHDLETDTYRVNPSPDTKLKARQTLVVLIKTADLDRLEKYLSTGD